MVDHNADIKFKLIKTSGQITQASDKTDLCYIPKRTEAFISDGTKLRCCQIFFNNPCQNHVCVSKRKRERVLPTKSNDYC